MPKIIVRYLLWGAFVGAMLAAWQERTYFNLEPGAHEMLARFAGGIFGGIVTGAFIGALIGIYNGKKR